ncbi:hypothetical protein [Mesorhizobium sp. SARCC-RB16n]|uniref:hypothetical protein n=1 Tax=Mesorhizobium sp. SARCC-RB16n TaxID=2116687 RepID=UPI00122FB009|nr:hypothetical protein [Mesorhizobium sp. SARCC-RB16n]
MNRDRRTFGRRLTDASTPPVSPTADASLLAGMTDQERAKDRVKALGLIICRMDEMRQLAASHGLEPLGHLLTVAFTESCDAIRRERSAVQDQTPDAAVRADDIS